MWLFQMWPVRLLLPKKLEESQKIKYVYVTKVISKSFKTKILITSLDKKTKYFLSFVDKHRDEKMLMFSKKISDDLNISKYQ